MSQTLLHIDSSIQGGDSNSRNLSAKLVTLWQQQNPLGLVVTRDIVTNPIPHIDEALMAGLLQPDATHSNATQQAVVKADEIIDEFLAADVVVLGVPMYNFGIPSTLKVWVDHISRAGRTFKYTDKGPVGLAGDKRIVVVSTRGGIYEDERMDHQITYLKTLFGFLGISDIDVIQAEGLNLSGEVYQQNMLAAEKQMEVVVPKLRLAA